MSIVCSNCKKLLTVKESVLGIHDCGQVKPKSARPISRRTGKYVKTHFTELIAAEMRKIVA